MTCDELLKALGEYVDDATILQLYQEFATHLAGCNPCSVVVDNLRQTIRLYQEDKPYPMPAAFTDRLKQVLKSKWRETFPGAQVEK